MLWRRFNLVEARAPCATGLWVDMQCWQHLEDGGNSSLGGEMGLKYHEHAAHGTSAIILGSENTARP